MNSLYRKVCSVGAVAGAALFLAPAALAAPSLSLVGICAPSTDVNVYTMHLSGSGYAPGSHVSFEMFSFNMPVRRFSTTTDDQGSFVFFVGVRTSPERLLATFAVIGWADADRDFQHDPGEEGAITQRTISCLTVDEALALAADASGLNEGESASLEAKADAAARAVEQGHVGAALHQLDALLNEVEAMRTSGRIDPEHGSLVAAVIRTRMQELSGS